MKRIARSESDAEGNRFRFIEQTMVAAAFEKRRNGLIALFGNVLSAGPIPRLANKWMAKGHGQSGIDMEPRRQNCASSNSKLGG